MKKDLVAADLSKIFIVICMSMNGIHPFTIDYFQCNEVSHYSAEELCRASAIDEPPKEAYTLLQHQDKEQATGFACQEIQNVFFIECGVWAHSKFLKTPQIERKVPVSV